MGYFILRQNKSLLINAFYSLQCRADTVVIRHKEEGCAEKGLYELTTGRSVFSKGPLTLDRSTIKTVILGKVEFGKTLSYAIIDLIALLLS